MENAKTRYTEKFKEMYLDGEYSSEINTEIEPISKDVFIDSIGFKDDSLLISIKGHNLNMHSSIKLDKFLMLSLCTFIDNLELIGVLDEDCFYKKILYICDKAAEMSNGKIIFKSFADRDIWYLNGNITVRVPLRNSDKPVTNSKIQTYIMKDSSNGLYKIGKSKNPKYREKTLQSEKPSIKMIKVFSENIEKELHKRYKAQRVRGEWFNLNKIQLRYICTHF